MKKTTTIFILTLFLIQNINSQSMIWGHNIGGHTGDLPIDLDKTSNGVLLTTTISSESKGLYKYDTNGNLIWQFNFFEGLPNGEYSSYSFLDSEVDENDNIYTLLNFDGLSTQINDITINKGVSLLKIDSNGNLVWSKKISSLVSETDINLLYKNNNIYVLGNFVKTVNINDEISLTSQEYWDCYSWIYRYGIDYYIAKFDIIGNLVDAVSFGTEYDDYVVSATIDENSNIYFTGGSDFHGGCSTRYTHITKYNSNLELQWEKQISKEENNSQLLYPSNIYYSETSSKLYLWGYNLQEVIHNDYNIPTSPCASRSDAIGAGANLLEFEDNGNFIKYRHYPNCTVYGVWQVGGKYNTVTINKAGITEHGDNLIILSSIHGSMDFDNGTFESTHLISRYDELMWDENLFLMKVNKENFNSEFIAKFPGEDTNEYPESVDNPNKIILESNNLYLSASFECNPIHIFGSPVSNNSGNNDCDILISKVNLENVLSNKNDFSYGDFKIYPNPANKFIFFKSYTEDISRVEVYSLAGDLIKELEQKTNIEKLNISELSNGLYLIKLISNNNHTSIRKVLIKNH